MAKLASPTDPTRSIQLVSNAHLDPVWLWEWEEGAAAAISTFRTAADLCEAFDGFIFNHNEAILYRWVEEYAPKLFERIRELVGQGKWHIMGGWYLQPDCNMPSGESFIRQILLGRRYFEDKFDVAPTTAINFDPFGHTRGLVQILARSGYDSYLFCRPAQVDCPLERDEFVWEGYDGSQVLATRPFEYYLSHLGEARAKVERLMAERPEASTAILLWGVGDHGGGPSRVDLQELSALIASSKDVEIRHSTPEAYFSELREEADELPIHAEDLNPWGVGCYTSQIRVKQKHRALENALYAAEKMASAAWCQAGMPYPQDELREAMRDLVTSEFHDILPGSSIEPAEDMALRLMDHGLEILSRVKARAFFALSRGPAAAEDTIPVMVYNPHPFPIKTIIECEFQPPNPNRGDTFTDVTVYQEGAPLATQVEKELSNLSIDWRKRVAFRAELASAQMNRFDCQTQVAPEKPRTQLEAQNGRIRHTTPDLDVIINTETGLIDRYRAGGVDLLKKNGCCPMVMLDDADPWGSRVRRFRNWVGVFHLLSAEEAQRLSAVDDPSLPPVRVIEDGPVRSVVEAVLGYGDSTIYQRYKLPREGSEIEIELRVHWHEKDRMLKLSIPTPDEEATCVGQVAYGAQSLPRDGDEAVAQKWVLVVSEARDTALSVVNDGTYGLDFCRGELRLSLLRSAAYSALPIDHRPLLPNDRYSPRIDQGERVFRFWLRGGDAEKRRRRIDREALAHNEKPMALSFFPEQGPEEPEPFITLSDDVVQMTALKKTEESDGLIVRLFEPTGDRRTTVVSLPSMELERRVTLEAFEIKTFRVDLDNRAWTEVDLMEKAIEDHVAASTTLPAENRASDIAYR